MDDVYDRRKRARIEKEREKEQEKLKIDEAHRRHLKSLRLEEAQREQTLKERMQLVADAIEPHRARLRKDGYFVVRLTPSPVLPGYGIVAEYARNYAIESASAGEILVGSETFSVTRVCEGANWPPSLHPMSADRKNFAVAEDAVAFLLEGLGDFAPVAAENARRVAAIRAEDRAQQMGCGIVVALIIAVILAISIAPRLVP